MSQRGRSASVVVFLVGTLLTALTWATATDIALDSGTIARVARELHGRRVAPVDGTLGSRGAQGVFAQTVDAVPFVIAAEGHGSGTVIAVDTKTRVAFIATNHHVVTPPLLGQDGQSVVWLLFYEPLLAQEQFDGERMSKCLAEQLSSTWCQTLRRASRVGLVLGSDADRDLAVIAVAEPPARVRPIAAGTVKNVRPGDDVVVIGHPLGLLWSVTSGIVSGIRENYPVGSGQASAPRVTVVQTQAPVHPGNSGGPLLTDRGELLGIIVGSHLLPARTNAGVEAQAAAPGLNFAIAVDEVRDFVGRLSQKP